MDFRKFMPLEKMAENPDGSLRVFGLVTAEQPDLENEVCDYAGTKPLYEQKVAAMKAATSIDGMTPSIMPLREMHQLKAIGAGRTIDFDDAGKAIRMGFDVIDPDAIKKFRAGVLIGFSHGGSYVGELKDDPKFKGCKRYVCDPGEVSAVDSPCLPQALIESMKGRSVSLVKANGEAEPIALKTQTETEVILEGLMDDMAKMRDFIELATPILNSQKASATIHSELQPIISTEVTIVKISDQAGLAKAAKTLHDHLAGLKEKHEAAGEHMEKCMKAMQDKHAAVGEHIEKCMKACKDAEMGEEPEKAEHEKEDAAEKAAITDLRKSNEALTAKFAELSEKLAKMPAVVPAATGVGNDLNKADAFDALLN